MIRIINEKSGYDYGDYYIQYSEKDGMFDVIDTRTHKPIKSMPSAEDAEDYIDSLPVDIEYEYEDEPVDNNLPVKSTNRRNLRNKYSDRSGIAYVLHSMYGTDMYATKNGIGKFNDPEVLIFRSAEDARLSRNNRDSQFGIDEVELINGNIKLR